MENKKYLSSYNILICEPRRENKMDSKKVFASRLKRLIDDAGMQQKEFAIQFSAYIGNNTFIPESTLSSWVSGVKAPNSFEVLIALANYFGVTVDYLIGRTSSREDQYSRNFFYLEDFYLEINKENLKLYNNKPVFITYPKDHSMDRWGIYSYNEDIFYCNGSKIRNSDGLRYFAVDRDSMPISRLPIPLSMNEVLKSKYIWIEHYGSDKPAVNEAYTGWYKSNGKELLKEDGRVLPISGLDRLFHAYNTNTL